MNPPTFFGTGMYSSSKVLVCIDFINIHDKLLLVILCLLEGPQLPAIVFVHEKSIESFVFT